MKGTTVTGTIAAAAKRLAAAGVDGAAFDARLLVGHVLGLDRASLAARSAERLSVETLARIENLIERRARREPVSRILRRREFWSLDFDLSPATLDPRADSETLVSAVLDRLDRGRPWRVLDLGTGTGALLLALLSELPKATGLGIDIAPEAVATAAANAQRLGLSTRATFRVGDWAGGLGEIFDVVVANPPYIPSADIDHLQPEVRDFDPRVALDGGADGLAAYRAILAGLPEIARAGSLIGFEVGAEQARAVETLLTEAGFALVGSVRDLGGIERCILASFSKNLAPNIDRGGN